MRAEKCRRVAIISGAIASFILATTVVTAFAFPLTLKYNLSQIPLDWSRCSDQNFIALIQEGLGGAEVVDRNLSFRLEDQHNLLVATGTIDWQFKVWKILRAFRPVRC